MELVFALLGLSAITAFLIGLICLVYPIRAIRISTRWRAAAIMGVSFAVFIFATAMLDTRTEAPGKGPTRAEERKIAESDAQTEAPGQTSTRAEEKKVAEYVVAAEKDRSFENRT